MKSPVAILAATIAVAACGARSSLPVGAGGQATVVAPPDAGEGGDAAMARDADADADASAPDASVVDPCLTAPTLAVGQTVSGSTCDVTNPPGTSCSDSPATAFYRFELPAMSDIPLVLSGDLDWGVLCMCPQGPSCCVGPGGDTGPAGVDTALANADPAPRFGVLAVSSIDGGCGDYTVSLGP